MCHVCLICILNSKIRVIWLLLAYIYHAVCVLNVKKIIKPSWFVCALDILNGTHQMAATKMITGWFVVVIGLRRLLANMEEDLAVQEEPWVMGLRFFWYDLLAFIYEAWVYFQVRILVLVRYDGRTILKKLRYGYGGYIY